MGKNMYVSFHIDCRPFEDKDSINLFHHSFRHIVELNKGLHKR